MGDIVVRGGRAWSGRGEALPGADAPRRDVLVRDGRVVAVGAVETPPGAEVLDARGRLVVPGFTDAHVHLAGTGLAMRQVQLKGVPSVEEVLARVRERSAGAAPGEWIEGAGWDQHLWGGAFPDRRALDAAVPANPVVLHHTSAHAIWVNSAALAACGITRETADPEGGAIDRDADGEPAGILRDNASRLVFDRMPPLDGPRRRAALLAAQAEAHRLGLTGVHAMDVSQRELEALRELDAAGELPLRVRAYLSARTLERWEGVRTGDGSEQLAIGGVKFFADGALGSLTAWMDAPYAETGELGFPLEPVEELARRVRWCLEHGLAPAVHAIGDRANREVLGIFEALAGVAPGLPRRVEHAQLLAAGLPARFAAMGVHASVQPIHATQDRDKVDRYWGERGRRAYPFATLLRAGVNLAFGTDSPVETVDPLAAVRAAVLRCGDDRDDAWYPAERVSVQDAFEAYTAGPAAAAGTGAWQGRLAPGYAGDLVVLDGDPADVRSLRVVATVVGGAVVYRAGELG